MQVDVQAAAADLSKLIEAARSGEEVIIADGDTPLAKLVPVPIERRQPFQYDILADRVKGPIPDFLEPMEEDELKLWEGGREGRL